MAYSYYKDITIDKTKVMEDCTDFPVLIKVTDANLAHTSHGGHCESINGYDIGFKDANNSTVLSHELVAYNHETGAVVFWVKKPILDCDANDHIFMHYGDSGIVADQSSTNTWAADYALVAHGKDADTSHIHDSTSNANDGTKKGANEPVVYTSGKIHHAQDYDGTNDYIDFENRVVGTGNKTVSFWSYRDDDTSYQSYFSNAIQGGAANDDGIQGLTTAGHNFQVAIGNGSTVGHYVQKTPSVADAGWHYIVITFNTSGTLLSVYIDDAAAETSNTLSGSEVQGGSSMRLGTNKNSCPFDGKIEEFRCSTNVKSANWIHTEYHNQNDPATFMSFGVEVGGATAWTKALPDTLTISDAIARTSVWERTVSNTLSISDLISKKPGLGLIETLGLSDSLIFATGKGKTLSDVLSISDSIARISTWDRTISDTLAMSDLISKKPGIGLTETLTLADFLLFSSGKGKFLSDTISFLDVIKFNYDFHFYNTLSLFESIVKAFVGVCNIDDIQLQYYDGGGGIICLHKPYQNCANGNLSFNGQNFNFRSGSYASYIDDINDETLNLSGYEDTDAMIKFVELGIVADEGYEVSITGLHDEYNGVYVISSISYKPIILDVFEYSISLRFVRELP
jgi:hypothetical protein